MKRYRIAAGGVCLFLIMIDRLTKAWAVTVLGSMPFAQMPLLPGILSFQYTENTGAAFGMLAGMRILNGVLTLALLAFLAIFLYRHRKNSGMLLSGAAIMAGGLSHLYDRLLGRNIVDFIRLDFINFPIFNVADICICVGTALMAVFYLCEDLRSPE